MNDPNLRKIINANLDDIKNDNLASTLSHASSYLDYMYGYKDINKRKIELDNFIQEVKYLSNKLKIRNNSDGASDV